MMGSAQGKLERCCGRLSADIYFSYLFKDRVDLWRMFKRFDMDSVLWINARPSRYSYGGIAASY